MGADLIGHNGPRCNGLDIYYKMFFFGVRTSIIVLYWTYGPNQKQTLPLILISLLLLADASVAHLFYFSGSLQNTVQNVKCRWILMTWSKKSKTLSSIRSALGSFFSVGTSPINPPVPSNSCSLCARPFSSGDEFLLTDLRLFCRQCHEQELDHHGNGVRNGVRVWEREEQLGNIENY